MCEGAYGDQKTALNVIPSLTETGSLTIKELAIKIRIVDQCAPKVHLSLSPQCHHAQLPKKKVFSNSVCLHI